MAGPMEEQRVLLVSRKKRTSLQRVLQHCPRGLALRRVLRAFPGRSTEPKVTGSNPVGRVQKGSGEPNRVGIAHLRVAVVGTRWERE
jgi:hypothetical protein